MTLSLARRVARMIVASAFYENAHLDRCKSVSALVAPILANACIESHEYAQEDVRLFMREFYDELMKYIDDDAPMYADAIADTFSAILKSKGAQR